MSFFAQTFLHALIALFIVELAIRIWDIQISRDRFRYRLTALLLPIFIFPVLKIFDPARESFYFILDSALFSSRIWFGIKLWNAVPIGVLFLFLLLMTSLLTLIQEFIPVTKMFLFGKKEKGTPLSDSHFIEEICQSLKIKKPDIFVVEGETPRVVTRGLLHPSIFISDSLLKLLNADQMRSVLTHELVHVDRHSNLRLFLFYILRTLMFFNPISLVVFRRLLEGEEYICDDKAIALTKNPVSLISALELFSSDDRLLKDRLTRLHEKKIFETPPFEFGKYILTVVSILILNYFVV